MSELETQLAKALAGLSEEFNKRSTDLEGQMNELSDRLEKQNHSLNALMNSLERLTRRLDQVGVV